MGADLVPPAAAFGMAIAMEIPPPAPASRNLWCLNLWQNLPARRSKSLLMAWNPW